MRLSCKQDKRVRFLCLALLFIIMGKVIEFYCINCGKLHVSPNRYSTFAKYCSTKCQMEAERKERIRNWEFGIKIPGRSSRRRCLIELRGHRCESCGLSEWKGIPITIEVDHKDGNSDNNDLSNLWLLCPNCHSQTETYKGKNKGHGRHARKLRYREGKSY